MTGMTGLLRYAVAGLASTMLGALAHADPLAEARERYRQEMAACEHKASPEEMESCRKEARNALAEARRKRLDNGRSPDEYRQNALERCAAHQGDDRLACEARMRGEGRTQGSVEGGGVLRELETTIPPR